MFRLSYYSSYWNAGEEKASVTMLAIYGFTYMEFTVSDDHPGASGIMRWAYLGFKLSGRLKLEFTGTVSVWALWHTVVLSRKI